MLSRLAVNTARILLINPNISSQKIAKCKFSRLACNMINVSSRNNYVIKVDKHSKVIGFFSVRYQSTDSAPTPAPQIEEGVKSTNDTLTETTVTSQIPDIPDIPDIPVPPTPAVETILQLHPNGEPTLASIGLGGYSPSGLAQLCMEWLHISFDLPWWAAIMILTGALRLTIFPLAVWAKRKGVHIQNHSPHMAKLQARISEARQRGDEYDVAVYSMDLSKFMKEKKLNPLTSLVPVIAQAPFFISMFVALRRMTNVPVESLKTGGLWWFTDMTVHDPYYVLPIVTSFTTYLTAEMAMLGMSSTGGMRSYVVKIMPVVVCVFTCKFPAAVVLYWFYTNVWSCFQSRLLEVDAVKKYFHIPELKPFVPDKHLPPEPKKKFVEGFKDSWTNLKITRQLENKKYADSIGFNKAGKGPLVKTYKYNPTKTSPVAASGVTKAYNYDPTKTSPVAAKKR